MRWMVPVTLSRRLSSWPYVPQLFHSLPICQSSVTHSVIHRLMEHFLRLAVRQAPCRDQWEVQSLPRGGAMPADHLSCLQPLPHLAPGPHNHPLSHSLLLESEVTWQRPQQVKCGPGVRLGSRPKAVDPNHLATLPLSYLRAEEVFWQLCGT